MIKAGGFLVAVLSVVGLCTSPLLMNVNTEELGRLKSAVPPVILQDYDGHGTPDAPAADPNTTPEDPVPNPGDGASSGTMLA
jgi:hypothetical protein